MVVARAQAGAQRAGSSASSRRGGVRYSMK